MIILISLFTSCVTAQEISPPTDWALNDIKSPAKTAKYTLVSDPKTQLTYTINFNQNGFQNTLTSTLSDQYTTVALYMPYINQRRTIATGIGEDQKTALKNIQDQSSHISTTPYTMPYEEWTTNNTLERHTLGQKTILTINDQFQTVAINTTNNNKEVESSYNIIHLDSEKDLAGITLKPDTIYIITLERDHHKSWTKQKQILIPHEHPEQQNITFTTRFIEYY